MIPYLTDETAFWILTPEDLKGVVWNTETEEWVSLAIRSDDARNHNNP